MKKLLTILGALGLITTAGVNIISCGQGEKKLNIEVDQEKINLFFDDETEIKITNSQKLKNVETKSSDNQVVKITNISEETIQIKALKEGTAKIIISAANAQNKNVEITVLPLQEISLSKNNSQLYLYEDSDEIIINNFEDLENTKLKIKDPEIISADFNDKNGIITLLALAEGKTEIKVSANHAIEQTISVTVSPLFSIELDEQGFIKYLDEKQIYSQINNFDDLKNLEIFENENPEVVNAVINKETKRVEIKLLKPGESTIRLRAEHADSTWISIEVKDLEKFKLDKENPEVDATKTTTVEITDKGGVRSEDVKVSTENEEIATAKFDPETQKITISGKNGGSTSLTITAKHAVDKTITITVNSLKDLIILDKNEESMYEEETKVIKITNIAELIDPKIKLKNEEIATAELDLTTGAITITGQSGGSTSISVTAEHAIEKTIQITIHALSTIDIPYQNVEVGSNESTILEFRNFFDLTNVDAWSSDENLVSIDILPDSENKTAFIKVWGHFDLDNAQIYVTADHARKKVIEVNVIRTTVFLNKNESWIMDGKSKTVEISNFKDLKNVKVSITEDGGSATVRLDSQTGIITIAINNVGYIYRHAILHITADNAVEKTITIHMTSKNPLSMTDPWSNNIEAMIKEFQIDDELNFEIAKKTNEGKVNSQLMKQLAIVFQNSGIKLVSSNIISKNFDNIPSQKELDKGGLWDSSNDGDSSITFKFSLKTVTVHCHWYIFIK